MNKTKKLYKYLLPHEKELLNKNLLKDISHPNSSSIWLECNCSEPIEGQTTVYRVMGDLELLYLMENNKLPDSQPYQTIVEGENGRRYVEKYLKGQKKVDSLPTTVVEFIIPIDTLKLLFSMQQKIEDGAISHGLGSKGGGGLNIFNQNLISWKIVTVKRNEKKLNKK
eukprot:TRINITY_DN12555_c0_g1_i1.p1 TRINITY_DN12555_c0_g1~~TRINITY_DN12555_c0_g1_i1.p1  ORF type:complete len:168 (+),score=40.93 TRINITY_DN12555_c0_g1_i1:132-635(+)